MSRNLSQSLKYSHDGPGIPDGLILFFGNTVACFVLGAALLSGRRAEDTFAALRIAACHVSTHIQSSFIHHYKAIPFFIHKAVNPFSCGSK